MRKRAGSWLVFDRDRLLGFFFLLAFGFSAASEAARIPIRQLARVGGARDNHLTGYGLVTGLGRTGDSSRVSGTTESVVNMLRRFGIEVDPKRMKTRDAAAVMVTATLPPFARSGDRIDVTVSALGDARSLEGGVLLETPLQGPDGRIYALGQGAVAVGGFEVKDEDYLFKKNNTTVARIPDGALVEKEVTVTLDKDGLVNIYLNQPDFTTAARVAREVNRTFDGELADAKDGGLISVRIPFDYQENLVEFIAAIQEIPIEPQSVANKVVVNERTGTLVMGADVRIDAVAVSHGDLRVEIRRDVTVSRSATFGEDKLDYETKVHAEVEEQGGKFLVLPEGTTLIELTEALNAVGATPQDMISILQAVKRAGAMHAELEVI